MSGNKRTPSFFSKFGKVVIPVLFIFIGGVAWAYFRVTAPVMERGQPQRQISVVDVQTAGTSDTRARISAMGTVVAAREVTLKAQVSGMVRSVSANFVPGGLINKGSELLALDPADYEVAVKKARSALKNARAALSIEQGSQNIAREELRLLSEISNESVSQTDLALRKPQLEQAQAEVTSAEADLRQAQLDLDRARVKVPFNAMILERNVNVGTYAGTQDSLATVVCTDEFWVEAKVSLDQLALIDLDYPDGCPVMVRSQSGDGQWQGKVLQVSGKLNEDSRMATVIVTVKNPRGDKNTQPLMLDDYVYADITGRQMTNVIEIPREALQDNNKIWVNSNSSLDIRDVTLAWKGMSKVYVRSGIKPGEKVIVSSLSTPVQGMPLKTLEEQTEPSPAATDGK